MSTRLIEECFELEEQEAKDYSEYISIAIHSMTIIIVDPYMINIDDLIQAKPGRIAIVRVRRPGWGRGDIQKYICKLEL